MLKFFDGNWTKENFSEFLFAGHTSIVVRPPVMTSIGKVLALPVSMSKFDISGTVMSDEAEENFFKLPITKQMFISHAPKLNYLSIVSTENDIITKFLQIYTCINHVVHKLTMSRKLEEKV